MNKGNIREEDIDWINNIIYTGVFDTKNTFFEPTAHRYHEDS